MMVTSHIRGSMDMVVLDSDKSSPLKSGHKIGDFPSLTAKGREDVVTGMLKVFHLDVYALFDPGSTLSFMMPYLSMRFDFSLDVLLDPFYVSTLIGESIVSTRVYRNRLVSFSHRVTCVDVVELDMLDFDVILGMD
ncbi:hypothetical protein MTR67_040160 [Solanum verrucosum]|uniref:Gag-pol polyprotein n=1 Tax=Solanum verrucosum TaxID=315347 RepID=A0AAF0ZRE8_SOLVR|nr:hypothetical protein MTR67_040160 [Solanum verrucosum]